jgi:integrase
MALTKRGNIYWIRLTHNGERIQKSTGTDNKLKARELHDRVKAQLWQNQYIEHKPKYYWIEAALRWVKESSHKRSLVDDKYHLRWLHPYLENTKLNEIDKDLIQTLCDKKLSEGVSNATVNRMLALVRSILIKAKDSWDWLSEIPKIELLQEPNKRIRWLTKEEANKLLQTLPKHLADMAAFTLLTGLRASNVRNLKWTNIDLNARHAWIAADEVKTNKNLSVPLNQEAIELLISLKDIHCEYVFTYKGKPVTQCSTRAWRKALERCEITDFRWHDLRHTWASWHVQNGTSLQELQQLGGWCSFEMVLRYAHLSSEHLRRAAQRVTGTILVHTPKEGAV